MPVYTRESKIADMVFRSPEIIPVIGRFGISLGVGDLTVADACRERNVGVNFFVAVVNTYLNHDYSVEGMIDRISLDEVLDYLAHTDGYYMNVQLPNIERHFHLLLSKSEGNGNLPLLMKFFEEVKREMQTSIDNDMKYWFPAFKLADMGIKVTYHPDGPSLPYDNRLPVEKLHDLLTFFVVHLKGDCDRNLCMAVVSAIFTLEKDVRQNDRIRNQILRPMVESLIVFPEEEV